MNYQQKRDLIQRALDAAEAAESAASPAPWDVDGECEGDGSPSAFSALCVVEWDDKPGYVAILRKADAELAQLARNAFAASIAAHRASLPSVEAAEACDRHFRRTNVACDRWCAAIDALMPVAEAILGEQP